MSSRWILRKRDFTRRCIENGMTDRNPVRGFYHVYTYDIAEKEAEEDWVWSLQKDERLALLLLDIGKCAHRALSQEELLKTERIFSLFKDHGMQMVVRVVYDREGKGMEHEPKHIGQVLLHMRQLAPLIAAFSPHIFTLQGLFIGSWGEMHTSKFLEKEDLRLLYETLREATDGAVRISVRKPQQQRMLRSADGEIKTGLYDDAILSSETDMGTFGWIDDVTDPDIMWTPEQELAFMQLHTKRVPCGGEVLAGALKFSAEEVLARMKMMHLTYLNSVHEPVLWEHWKTRSCGREEALKANGAVTLYDYIRAHLGYRYVLEDVRLEQFLCASGGALGADGRSGEGCRLLVTVQNTGFACCYDSLRMVLTIGGQKFSVSFLEPQLAVNSVIHVAFDIESALHQTVLKKVLYQTIDGENAAEAELEINQQLCGKAELPVHLALYHEKTGLPVYFANDFSDSDKWDKYCLSSSFSEGVSVGVLSMEKEAIS